MFLEFFPAALPQILSLPSNSQPDRKKKRNGNSCILCCEMTSCNAHPLASKGAKAGQARSICIRRAKQKRVYPRHRRACGTQEKDATGNRLETTQPACKQRRGKRVAFASAERSKKGCTRGIAALAARKKKRNGNSCILCCEMTSCNAHPLASGGGASAQHLHPPSEAKKGVPAASPRLRHARKNATGAHASCVVK